VAIIPIFYHDRVVGAIHIADILANKISREKVEFTESITPFIGEAIHRFNIEDKKNVAEEKLQYLATHDYLTRVPNRYSLEQRLEKAIKGSTKNKCALLFLDIDNFKIINNAFGHAAGDEFLQTLVDVLKNNLPASSELFRFSGDEFAVILEGKNLEEVKNIAEKLRQAVGESELCISLYNSCFNLTISIGIVMVEEHFTVHKLLARANNALHMAKESGRNRVIVVPGNEDITYRWAETNQLIGVIKDALRYDKFELHFQPVMQIIEEKVVHYETLLRLRGDNGVLMPPNRFIPVAEQFGLMPQVDYWVVRSSLDILKANSELRLFINLSGISLSDEILLKKIINSIIESGIDPSRLGFEITETAAVNDLKLTEQWIDKIRSLGCSFALDDFGKGFSSFYYLSRLPIEYLKIDGSFIRQLDQDPVYYALVQAMNNVAHALGKKTIAEFVENKGILTLLQELKIDYGQGFHFGKPLPL